MYTEFFFDFVNITFQHVIYKAQPSSVTKTNSNMFLSTLFPQTYEENVEVCLGHGLTVTQNVVHL